MDKGKYDQIINAFFAVMVGLTFFNLYKDIIWLSGVLAVIFLLFVVLHIKYFRKQNPKSKKIFVFALILLLNFFLTNAVIIIAEFVYPY